MTIYTILLHDNTYIHNPLKLYLLPFTDNKNDIALGIGVVLLIATSICFIVLLVIFIKKYRKCRLVYCVLMICIKKMWIFQKLCGFK